MGTDQPLGVVCHLRHLVVVPEWIPVVLLARFDEGVEVALASLGPELARPFEASLLLRARRLHRPAANRPAAPRQLLVVHPPGVVRKIVFLPPDDFSSCPAPCAQSGEAPQHGPVLTMPQVVALAVDPLSSRAFVPRVERLAQRVEVLAGMVEVQ